MYCVFLCLVTGVLATLSSIPSILASASSEDSPIGISLGTDYITSAYITKGEDFVTVANIEATKDWKDFARSILRVDGDTREYRKYTESDVDELITTSLSSILEATIAKLNRKVEIIGITHPAYITDNGYSRNLLDVAYKVLPGMKDSGHAWPYLHSVRKANRLDNANALGYPARTNIDLEDSLLLHFDYQNSILEVSITSITTDITSRERHFRIANFGGARQVASPKMLENLRTRVKALIEIELSQPYQPAAQLSDFRGIVFSGDASASEFKKIQEAIIEAVPELADRFINKVEPQWAGAIGAAILAREIRLNPQAFQIQEQIYEGNPHDEL